MHTYQIHATSQKKLKEAAFGPSVENQVVSRFRATLLTRKKLTSEELKGCVIAAHLPRDAFKQMSAWATSNVLDELHDEFLRKKRHPNFAQRMASVRNWEEARHHLAQMQEALDAAKREEEKAARRVVLMHGKVPIQVGDETFDPGCVREHVYFTRRQS